MGQPARKKRSVSMIKEKPKHKLVNLHIEFNELGQAIGKNRFEFTTYCGVTVKTRISILQCWNEVSEAEIDELWLNIKTHWNIPNDDYKAQVLKVCNQQWRTYKSKLLKFMDKGIDPLKEFPYLEKETWKTFVKENSTPEFQDIRVKATASVKMNKNPPRLGPLGYRGNRPRWEKEMESGEMTKVRKISSRRARDYIFARLKRDASGTLRVTPQIEPIVDALVEKQNEVTQADSEIAPGSDLLVEVLGPEHPGRLRAMGYNVGLKQSIIGIKEKNRKQEVLVLKEMKDKQEDHSTLIADMREEITMLRREMAGNRNKDVTSPVVNQTSIGSAPMVDVLDNITVATECELLLPYGMVQRKCAKGQVFPCGNGILHTVPMQKDHVRVSVDKIYNGYDSLPIPVPTTDAEDLGAALYSFIRWPRHAILLTKTPHPTPIVEKDASPPIKQVPVACKTSPILDDQVQQYKKRQETKRMPPIANKPTVMPKKLQDSPMIQSWYSSFTSHKYVEEFHVESEPGFFGPARIETYIRPEVILEMLNREELDINCIIWYQMVLHSILATNGANRCAFINPQSITETECDLDDMDINNKRGNRVVNDIVDTMRYHQDKHFFLAPYWQSRHWLLLVICPYQRMGYILDSVKKSGNPLDRYKVISHVERAVATYNGTTEISHPMKWTFTNCNQQLSNRECGYYVMKWMREFVMYRQHVFPKNLWNDKNPISGKLLDEMVNTWMTTFERNYMK